MFVQVSALLPKKDDVVVVPQEAVTYTLYGNSVYIINKKTDTQGKLELIVKQQTVTVGQRQGNSVAILKGLKANQQVVTAGN